jgi:hypothetical protein
VNNNFEDDYLNPIITLTNGKIKGKNWDKNQAFGSGKWQYYTHYLLKMNSESTLSASRISVPPQLPRLLSRKQTTMA